MALESQHYNAAQDLVQRNLTASRADKTAFIDDRHRCTFAQLHERVCRFADALRRRGIAPEQRILLCLHDSIDFPVAFLGAIRAGVVPVPVNTLLTPPDYAYMLQDSQAQMAFVSAPLAAAFAADSQSVLPADAVVLSGASDDAFGAFVDSGDAVDTVAATTRDDICFWLYSSGSTGRPKAAVHLHSSLILTAELYAQQVLGIRESDVTFSAAKLFFAYGLGNALTFPMSVGATSVLMSERPTPASVCKRLTTHPVTIFYGVPTLYASLLASAELPVAHWSLRACTSAGEPLPEAIGQRWRASTGIDILDGIGSTEMLHIYLANAPGDVRYGTTGKPVPGYAIRLLDEHGAEVPDGELGELFVSGPTSATMYWRKRDKSRTTFMGEWTRSGDKYLRDAEGYYRYAGRTDDMLKVGGIYVSPAEVEAALVTHTCVLEVAVVGREDGERLVKPAAYVVVKSGVIECEQLAAELKEHVKSLLAPYKYPRWIEFVPGLPKTATGKIQRFRLRAEPTGQ